VGLLCKVQNRRARSYDVDQLVTEHNVKSVHHGKGYQLARKCTPKNMVNKSEMTERLELDLQHPSHINKNLF
jgi:hypothetical protein